MNNDEQEALFDRVEREAVLMLRESQRLAAGDNKASVALLKQANQQATRVSEARAAFRKQETSYTPTTVPQEEVISSFEQGNVDVVKQGVSNFQEQHEAMAEGGFTKNLTVPFKLSKFSDNIVNPEESGLDEYVVRQTANTVVPVIAAATMNIAKGLGQTFSNVIPDEIETRLVEQVKEIQFDTVRKPWFKAMESAWERGVDAYDKLVAKDPAKAELFEDTMASAFMLTGRAGVAKKGQGAGKKIAVNAAQKQRNIDMAQTAEILSPVEPTDMTKVQGKWDTSRSIPVYLPNQSEIDSALVVSKLKGWDPKQSIGKNNMVVQKAKGTVAERLEKTLMNAGNPSYGKNHMISQVNLHVEELRNTNAFQASKGGQDSVDPMLNELAVMMDAGAPDAMGLLQLRRDFDKWSDQDMGLANFDKPDRAKVQKIVKAIRNTLNDELAMLAPDAPVKHLLRTQSALYQAGERTVAKYSARTKGFIASLNNGLYPVTGMKIPATIGAVVATGSMMVGAAKYVGGIGAVAGAGATGLAAVIGVKAATSYKTRQWLGATLEVVAKKIDKTTDPIQSAILRSDRALILDMLSESRALASEEETQQ
jgi:hypothetical protein